MALVQASEKAANIARSCRQEETLFSLLIEEKKSQKFSADFKTLADVLVQEVIKHDIGKQVKLRSEGVANALKIQMPYLK